MHNMTEAAYGRVQETCPLGPPANPHAIAAAVTCPATCAGKGWHLEPHVGSRLVQLPTGSRSSSRLMLKSTLASTQVNSQLGDRVQQCNLMMQLLLVRKGHAAITYSHYCACCHACLWLQVAVRFMCLRRGYEFLLEAFVALWDAVAAGGGAAGSASGARSRGSHITHVDQLWEAGSSSTGPQVGVSLGVWVCHWPDAAGACRQPPVVRGPVPGESFSTPSSTYACRSHPPPPAPSLPLPLAKTPALTNAP